MSGSRASSVPAKPRPAQTGSRSYGSGARILSIGIASTGLLTFAYFSLSSHVLNGFEAKRIDLLWSVMFVVISVIYRPIEQLLSRTIAQRRAQGHTEHALRVPISIQLGFALAFLVIALALRGELVNHVFDGFAGLYYVLVVGTLAYAASYFARGWLAGHQYFALYGGLVLDGGAVAHLLRAGGGWSASPSGQLAVALGIAAAPFVSLIVVPAAFARRARRARGAPEVGTDGAPDRSREEADAALAGPGAEGIQEAAAERRAVAAPRLELRSRGCRASCWPSRRC